MRRLLLPVSAVVALGVLSGPVGAAPTSADPVLVGTDAVSDWGGGGDRAIVGHALSQDLLSASIGMSAPDKVEFTMEVSFLPSTGGVPEISRYTWDMLVDTTPADGPENAKFVELDGKFTNYSRGTCDPTAGSCPPPRNPGERPFAIRGDCTTNAQNVTVCRELGLVQAVFTPGMRTITVPVTLAQLTQAAGGAVTDCSIIYPGANIFGGSISAAPSAFFSNSLAPLDTMELTGAFQVPTDGATPCPPPQLPTEE